MNAVPRAVSPALLPTAARHHLQPLCTACLCLPPHLRLPFLPLLPPPMAALKAAAPQCAMLTASRRVRAPPYCLSPCHCLLLPMAAHLRLPPRAAATARRTARASSLYTALLQLYEAARRNRSRLPSLSSPIVERAMIFQ